MEFTVINEELSIGDVSILSVSISSVVMVGDLTEGSLVCLFETPLEPNMFWQDTPGGTDGE